MAEEVPSIEEQDEEGVYFEEVAMIVDNIVHKIVHGEIKSRDKCGREAEEDVGLASHTNDDDLCMRVLKWSKHPTAFFFNNGKMTGEDWDHHRKLVQGGDYPGPPWDAGKKAFPWRAFALDAMEEDVKTELFARKEFKALPTYEPDEDDD